MKLNAWRKFVKAHEEYIECLDMMFLLVLKNLTGQGAEGAEASI